MIFLLWAVCCTSNPRMAAQASGNSSQKRGFLSTRSVQKLSAVHHEKVNGSGKKTCCGVRWIILLIVIPGIALILLLTVLSLRISLAAHQTQQPAALGRMGDIVGGPVAIDRRSSGVTANQQNIMMDSSSHHSLLDKQNFVVQGRRSQRSNHDRYSRLSETAEAKRKKDLGMNASDVASQVVPETTSRWKQSTQSANTCVGKRGGQCRAIPCGSDDSTTEQDSPKNISYYDGLIYRPNNNSTIRGTPMQLSGHAKSGSGCALSHQYQFLYVHVLKSGGMTLKGFLKQGLCDGSTQMPCRGDEESQRLQIVDCGRAIREHPHYFVWSFVRNPFSRMYSAYAMALNYRNRPSQKRRMQTTGHGRGQSLHSYDRLGDDHNNTMLPEFDFATFVMADKLGPRHHSGYAKYHGSHNAKMRHRQLLGTTGSNHHSITTTMVATNNSPNMEQLMGDFWANATDGHQRLPPKKRNKLSPDMRARKSMTHMDLVHCQPQTKFLFDANDCPVFDFVGHLESFEDDLRHLVTNLLGSPELQKHFKSIYGNNTAEGLPLTIKDNSMKAKSTSFGTKQKQATLGGNLQIAYQSAATQGHDIQQAVANEFARDFRLLGYDPSVVPR